MLTNNQAARRKGCDPRTVKRATEVGDLTLHRGKLREADVDAWEPRRTKPRLAEQEAAARVSEEAAPDPEAREPTVAERIKLIELERKEQEWLRDQGKLIDRDAVMQLLADFGHRVRSEIQSHPRKMQAVMVKRIRCTSCGGGIDGKIIAIEAERCVAQLLRLLADNPLGGSADA